MTQRLRVDIYLLAAFAVATLGGYLRFGADALIVTGVVLFLAAGAANVEKEEGNGSA